MHPVFDENEYYTLTDIVRPTLNGLTVTHPDNLGMFTDWIYLTDMPHWSKIGSRCPTQQMGLNVIHTLRRERPQYGGL